MFDLTKDLNKINKFTSTRDGVAHAFYRNGITNTENALNLCYAIAEMHKGKSLYADRVGKCVRFMANVEYGAQAFSSRLAALEQQLHYLNTPFFLATEELNRGNGIDFYLLVKGSGGKPGDLKLESLWNGHYTLYGQDASSVDCAKLLGNYPEQLQALGGHVMIRENEISYFRNQERKNASGLYLNTMLNDDRFSRSAVFKKLFELPHTDSTVSVVMSRWVNKTVDIKLLSKLEEI